jgi:hypothetical protein
VLCVFVWWAVLPVPLVVWLPIGFDYVVAAPVAAHSGASCTLERLGCGTAAVRTR